MFDSVSLGEALVDLLPLKVENMPNSFHAVPGGATLNCVTQLSHLGFKTSYISTVGNDVFGKMLVKALDEEHVDMTCFRQTDEANTTLAIVSHDAFGARDFSFYRKPVADMMIHFDEEMRQLLDNARSFHVGTISLIGGPAKQTTMDCLDYAKSKGKIISFDPNFRLNIWDDPNELVEITKSVIPYANLMKISAEEIQMLTGLDDLHEAKDQVLREYENLEFLAVTNGAESTICTNRVAEVEVSAFKVKAIDTTGCGDSFTGSLISRLIKSVGAWRTWGEEELKEAVTFANAAGAVTATRFGAMPILPREEEILAFLDQQ